jgi:hydrogenase maturation protein HypF
LTLVMTSGNVSDEPIAFDDGDALERLAGIADRFLVHDRPIETRTDDSVVRGPLVLRRSRGLVPASIALPLAERPLLACGAELKSTFCLAKGGRAWVGHHVGDLKNWETLRSYREGVAHFERLFAIDPEVVAHDLHPDYLSTAYALERDGVEHVAVQHHHAHLAACLAEHGQADPAVGAIYDGAGLGTDGAVWGGELLVGGVAGCERAGHLWPVRLPGGDAAVREPWRMACAWLHALGEDDPAVPAALADSVPRERWEAVEAACDPGERGAYPMPLAATGGDRRIVLDARATVAAVRDDLARGAVPGVVAARFHGALAGATAAACELAAARGGLGTVVLSGGAFQNRVLLERTSAQLAAAGLRVLVPRRLPPNDGGIAFGQAAVASAGRPLHRGGVATPP